MTPGPALSLPEPLLGLDSVETPLSVVDLRRARANAQRVAEYAARHDLAWRPHVKTHKSLGMARIQLDAGARGLTVATVREAEVMAEICDDLLLAYPPVASGTVERLAALPEGVRLSVALDSFPVLEALSRRFREAERAMHVLVELDVGMARTGVSGAKEVVELARRADELPGVAFEGLLFYPGHIRVPLDEQGPLLGEVRERLEAAALSLEAAGLPPLTVSGGSTPTLWRSHELPLTEIRAGTCIYHDRDTVALGVASPEECAYSVLSTVVSVPAGDRFVLDAGSKALAKEPLRAEGAGFGYLQEKGLCVSSLSEEHGVVRLTDGEEPPSVGERFQVVPNHVCVSVNLQEGFVVVDGEEWDYWPVDARGRRESGGAQRTSDEGGSDESDETEDEMTTIRTAFTERAPEAIGPYSQAVVTDGWIFVSGQIPLDPSSGDLVAGDIQGQTRRVLENVKAIVEEAGGSLATVVKTTVFLADMADFGAMNEVYAEYLGDHRPARSTIQAGGLPKGVAVEVDAIARTE